MIGICAFLWALPIGLLQAGTTPPTLISLTASSPVAAGGTVRLTARIVDNQSGVDETRIQAILLDPSGTPQVSVRDFRHQGNNIYVGEATIGSTAMAGNWIVRILAASDRNLNTALFLHGIHHNAGFQVTSSYVPPPPDTTPPTLHYLSASSPVVAGESVTITARLRDNQSGVDPNRIYAVLLDSEGGGQITLQDWEQVNDDTFVGQAQIGPGARPGNWQVRWLQAYDNARNGAMFLYGEHHHVGFQVINPTPDVDAPRLTSLSLTPNPVTLNQRVTVTIGVTDRGLGLDHTNMLVHLTPNSFNLGHSHIYEWEEIAPDTYRGSTLINPQGPAGSWGVHSIYLRDLAGNAVLLRNGVDYNKSFTVQQPARPDIYRHPNNHQRPVGESATFSVAAVGAPPLAYQWRRNGVPIAGATTPQYQRTVASEAENGDQYDVIVSNASGSVTSRVATLRTGAGNYQSLLTSHAPNHWYRLDNDLTDSGVDGGRSLTRDGGKWGNGGIFGPDFEGYEQLAWYADSGQDLIYQADNVIHDVGSISLLLKMPDAEINRDRVIFNKGSGFQLSLSESSRRFTFRLGNVSIPLPSPDLLQDTWYYFGASWNIPEGNVRWAFGQADGSVQNGSRGVSTNSSAGVATNPLILGNRNFRQWDSWRFDSRNGGIDEVAIWNRELTEIELLSQFAALTTPTGSVAIITHPLSQEIYAGASVEFTARLLGEEPISYQWMRDGTPIPDATNAILRVIGVTQDDDGAEFSVTASNPSGTATSLPATLTIKQPRVYQETVLSQIPDYWFPLDNTLAGFGTRPAPDLTSMGNFSVGRLPQGDDNLGTPNSAFIFPGGNDHLAQEISMVERAGSMSLLFRTPALPFTGPNRHVFNFGGSASGGDAMLMRFSPSGLSLILGSESEQLIEGTPLLDTWYYFALTWDLDHAAGPRARWHLGPLDAPLETGLIELSPSDQLSNQGIMYFGNRNDREWDNALREGGDAPGSIDEIAFWSRQLTLEEIQTQHVSHTAPAVGPIIGVPPQDIEVIAEAQAAVFSVGAAGVGPLQHQWLLNEHPVPGATNSTFSIPVVTEPMDGDEYRVVVTDNLGTATSTVARLTVLPATTLLITSHPQDATTPEGATAHFAVEVIGQDPLFQWFKADEPIAGGTHALLTLTGPDLSDDGASIHVVVSNAQNAVQSLPATLTVTPSRIYQRTVLSHLPDYWFPMDGTLANFGTQIIQPLRAVGDRLPTATDNVGNTNSAFEFPGGFDFIAQDTSMMSRTGSFSLLFRTPNGPFDGPNRHLFHFGGSPSNGNALFARFSPGGLSLATGSINTQLIEGTPLLSTWHYFALTWDLDHPDGPRVQWHLGPLDQPLETGVVPLAPGDVLGIDGRMFFGHRNGTEWDNAFRAGSGLPGTIDEIAFWSRQLSQEEIQLQHASHTAAPSGPQLIAQPEDSEVIAEVQPATFAVEAFGVGALSYQWLVNEQEIPGATNSAYTIANVTEAMDQDEFQVWVTDSLGTTTSQVARLSVLPVGTLQITAHPEAATTPEGATAHFQVEFIGPDPEFQWMKNGQPIPGATNSNLALTGPTLADDGAAITVVLSNAINTVESQPAILTVTPSRLYQQIVLSHLPDYWFPLDGTLDNFGTRMIQPIRSVSDRLPDATDNIGNTNSAFAFPGGFDFIAQDTSMMNRTGSFSLLFRTPDGLFDGPNRHIFHFGGSPSNGNALFARFSPGGLTLITGSISTPLIAGTPLLGTWHYFAMTWDLDHADGPRIKWHLGPLDEPLETGEVLLSHGDVLGTGGTMFFGHRNGTEWDNAFRAGSGLPGTIDEIAFWSRQLALEEIQLQHASHTTPYTGPSILDNPQDLTVDAFEPATFSVSAEGIGSLTYQWFSNGVAVATATNAIFEIPSARVGMDQAEYAVRVTDDFGSIDSAIAVLTVIPPPPDLTETITSLNPDYWFRFNNTFENSGSVMAPDLIPTGITFGDNAYSQAASAAVLEGSNASLEQSDLIASSGTLSLLFRTPDAPMQTAYVFAQGTDTLAGDAFSLSYAEGVGLALQAGDSSAVLHPAPLPLSRWFMLTLTWDESRSSETLHWWLGLIGGEMTSGTMDTSATALIGDGGPWTLGNEAPGGASPWQTMDNGSVRSGRIDEVALWSQELPPASVSNLFTSAAVGGPLVSVIIGGDIRNGNFNADTSATDRRTFAETPFWQNIGTGGQGQAAIATRSNQTFDGTRNAQITDNDSIVTGMDTDYTLSAGDLFDLRYVWDTGFEWSAGGRVGVTLFITDTDSIGGDRTELVTSFSAVSSINDYELVEDSAFYTAPASVAGKRLFVAITGADGNPGSTGFARLDNFELIATTPGLGSPQSAGTAESPLQTRPLIQRARRVADSTGEPAIELEFATQPGTRYTIAYSDCLKENSWQTAHTFTSMSSLYTWRDQGDEATGRLSPFQLPNGGTRLYRIIEEP